MKKLLIGMMTALAVVAAAFPVAAQEEEPKEKPKLAIPQEVQVTDPAGDANYQNNDWQTGGPHPDGTDILSAWFDNDAESITAHLQLDVAPSGQIHNWYQITVNPVNALDSGGGCILFEGMVPGNSSPGGAESATVADSCGAEATETEGKIAVVEASDGTGVVTLTFPRTASPHFEKDSILFTPFAEALQMHGAGGGGLGFTVDNTKSGSDYTVTGKLVAPKKEEPKEGEGEEGEEPSEEEPEEPKPAPKPKKKPKKGKGCAPYVPGEAGKEAKTEVVTEAATAEKPVEIKLATDAGFGSGRGDFDVAGSHAFQNVQVDTAGAPGGLYASVEFSPEFDYDLYMDTADGKEVAAAGGFGPEQDSNAEDSETALGSETITGIETADCGGYTLDVMGATTAGEEVTLKLWLGEVKVTPEAAAVSAARTAVLAIF